MLSKLYKRSLTVYLALKNNKVIEFKDNIITAYDVKRKLYTIWMKQDKFFPIFLESCNSKIGLDFKVGILEEKGVPDVI